MNRRLLIATVAIALALNVSTVLAQCGCDTAVGYAPAYTAYYAPTVAPAYTSYYAPAALPTYTSYYSPAATYYAPRPYVSYYAPYATYAAPYSTYYVPGWRRWGW